MDQKLRLKFSSHVHEAKYDPQAERLTLTLNNGVFAVHGVSPSQADAYEKAQSHGDFFFKNFHKNKKHEITRVR